MWHQMVGAFRNAIDAAPAAGGVSVNATGVEGYQSSSTTSFSYTGLTVAAGTHTAIVFAFAWDSVAAPPTGVSVVWDVAGANQAASLIVSKFSTGDSVTPGNQLWGLAGEHGAVATGNKTLSISWTGNHRLFVCGMAFDGVNQTGGATSFPNTASDVTPAATVTVTSATGNKVMGTGASGTPLAGITGTTIYSDSSSGSVINAYANYDNGAASVVIGQSNANATIVATDIQAG